MEKLIKENKNVVIVVIVISGLLFYWFQLRPSNIKKSCSWITETIPADAGITKEQAEVNKKTYEECLASNWKCVRTKEQLNLGRIGLERDGVERMPQPETEETRDATKKEYDLCLRQNGL